MLSIEISRELTELRKGAGYTQQELADILMVSRNTVGRIETGIQVPDTLTWLNWVHVCTTEPIMLTFNRGTGGVLQTV